MARDASPERHLVAEISVGAIEHNLGYLRSLLEEGCEIWPVVKANAYGLGLRQLWPVLSAGSEGLCVSNFREALQLRDWGYDGPLLILFSVGAISKAERPPEVLCRLVRERVELTVAAADEVERVAQAAASVGEIALLHLKIDTGMHRGGAPIEEASEVLTRVQAQNQLRLVAAYTHFAIAEEPASEQTRHQLDSFLRWITEAGLGKEVALHAANSAAVLELGSSHLNRVRPGIAVYGYPPADRLGEDHDLRPALTLKSRVMQIKPIAKGEACGYGMTYRFSRSGRIGLVPIGYADGYLRALGNRACMRIRGREVPVRGTVSMDQTIVDLTDLPEARVEDDVEIIAADSTAGNAVERIARLSGTIPYEVLTRLGSRIERRLVP